MVSIKDELQIPVIDISSRNQDAPKQLLDAACRFGFVFVANNEAGISHSLIADLFELSKQFFALPTEVKQAVSINSNKAGKNHGWLSQGVEKLDPKVQKRPDVKESVIIINQENPHACIVLIQDSRAFNMGIQINGHFEQPLPDLIQQNVEKVILFQEACHALCQRILHAFAIALEISPDWFTSRHDATKGPIGSIFRLLYYPKATETQDDGDDIRAGAHSDYGSITCLFQLPGQPGLEIKTPSGEWAAVPVDPLGSGNVSDLPILVNIGDLLEDWTGGLLKSTVHRVVFPKEDGGDRYSIGEYRS